MSEKKNKKKVYNLIKENSPKYIKSQQVVGFENDGAIEQAIKVMDISNKLVPQIPKTMVINEQVNKIINTNIPIMHMPTFMPNYQNMLTQIKSATGLDKISTMAGEFARQQLSICSENIMRGLSNSMSNVISQIAEVQMQFINSITETINKSITPAFKALSDSLEEARNNPDSRLSWMNYYDRLSEFFWIMPYKITTEELHEILQCVETEKEFDKYINRYFTKTKVNSLFYDIRNMLSNNNQRRIFNQIVKAYENKSYALASIGITTMIDNFLSYYLIDKACSSRMKLFEPIINDLDLKRNNSNFSFIVMMVNSNINLLYEKIEFNNKISINTNKKSRRNPIAHGKSYSYKKIDAIMLTNTLFYLLVIQNELKEYKNSLYRKNKEFYILSKEEKNKIKAKLQKSIEN